MFQRIQYEDWQLVFPVVALAAAAACFMIMTWRSLRLPRAQAERLARLPLADDAPPSPRHE